MNTGVGATPALSLAAAVARPWLRLSEKQPPKDLVVPEDATRRSARERLSPTKAPSSTLRGCGKLLFRNQASGAAGPMSRQSSGVYAVTEDIEVHFLTRNGRASWGIVYTGGMFMDAKRRVTLSGQAPSV